MISQTLVFQDGRGYSAAERQASTTLACLACNYSPPARAHMLDRLAAAYDRMAELHMAAFRRDPNEGEADRDMAAILASSARLVRLVAMSEHALAGAPLIPLDVAVALADATTPEQLQILGALSGERDRAARAELIEALRSASVDKVGDRAAAVLSTLAEAERNTAGRRRTTWRAVHACAGNAASAALNVLVALAAGVWCAGFLTTPTTGTAIRAGVVAIAVFGFLTAIDVRVDAWWHGRRCGICGSATMRGRRLRFYRLGSVYPSVHIACQRWLPRQDLDVRHGFGHPALLAGPGVDGAGS
jgi:hypothetical protein